MGMMGQGYPGMQGGMHGGMPGGMQGSMQGAFNPYSTMMPAAMGQSMMPTGMGMGGEDSLKPFDSSKLKQGRMGHYGYLEGRGEYAKDQWQKLIR